MLNINVYKDGVPFTPSYQLWINNMKTIFLDIDGVLNSTGDENLIENTFDKDRICLVRYLSIITNSKIIIISDRRIYEEERNMIDKVFNEYKINYDYLSLERTHRKRSDEIKYYLGNHKDITNYVILDDCDSGYSTDTELVNHFVNTNKNGFNQDMCDKAFNILAYTCDMCGNKFDMWDEGEDFHFEHHFGYGTKYDLNDIDVHICCSCMEKILDFAIPKFKKNPLKEYEL